MSLFEHRTTSSRAQPTTTAVGFSLAKLVLLPAVAAWGYPAIAAPESIAIRQPTLTLAQSLADFQEISFRPPTPPDVGSPRERRGAASRGGTRDPGEGCPVLLDEDGKLLPKITALVPAYDLEDQSLIQEAPSPDFPDGAHTLYGSTVEPYPTLWLYLPYDLTPNRPGELRAEVVGDDGVPIQQTLMTYTDAAAGIIGIPLSGTALDPLEVGEWWDLIFVIRCDLNDPAQNLTVGLTVQRVATLNNADITGETTAASLESVSLETVSPLDNNPEAEPVTASREQAVAFAEAGIWHDLLTTLATLRRENPENPDFIDDWSNLLRSVGLADVAEQALSDCCAAPVVIDDETSSE